MLGLLCKHSAPDAAVRRERGQPSTPGPVRQEKKQRSTISGGRLIHAWLSRYPCLPVNIKCPDTLCCLSTRFNTGWGDVALVPVGAQLAALTSWLDVSRHPAHVGDSPSRLGPCDLRLILPAKCQKHRHSSSPPAIAGNGRPVDAT